MEPMPFPGADKYTWFRTPNITPLKGSALMKFPGSRDVRRPFQGRWTPAPGIAHALGVPLPHERRRVGAIYNF